MSTSVTALAANFDIDTLTSTGTFTVVTPTNAPAADTNYLIVVNSVNVGGNSRQVQCAYSMLDGAMSTRVYLDGAWTTWASGGSSSSSGSFTNNHNPASGTYFGAFPRANSNAMVAYGCSISNSNNTTSTIDPAGDFIESKPHLLLQAAAVGHGGNTRLGSTYFHRGSAAGYGGFEFSATFGWTADPDGANGQRVFCGVHAGTASPAVNSAEPQVQAVNSIGMIQEVASANVQLMHSDGSTATVIDLSATFGTWVKDDLYNLSIVCPSGADSDVVVTIERLTPGRTATYTVTLADGTDVLPAEDVALSASCGFSNANVATGTRYFACLGMAGYVPHA